MVVDKNGLKKITDNNTGWRFNRKKLFNQIKYFLIIFLPLLIVLVGVPLAFINYRDLKASVLLEMSKVYKLLEQKERISEDLRTVSSLLIFMANTIDFKEMETGPDSTALKHLGESFLLFSNRGKYFDQIRYLDKTGRERIRINFKHNKFEIVSADKLQDKGDRYYFKDCFHLKKGDLYISPFDLNVENQNIEVPYKPTIRLGTPVFNRKEQKQGILIFNYLGNNLLRYLRKNDGSFLEKHTCMLLNSAGYWLYSHRKEDEWGFMFKEKKDRTFAHDFPGIWSRIKKRNSGQFYDNDGSLYTFNTIYPLLEAAKNPSISASAKKSVFWKIVHRIGPETIASDSYKSLGFLIIGIVLLPLSVGSWILAVSKEQQKYDATYDPFTELVNHQYFLRELSLAVSLAKRHEHPLSICLCDLDDFKLINETYGSKIGDEIVLAFAKLAKNNLRLADAVSRYGGDEFGIIFPYCKSSQAAVPTEKLRLKFEEMVFGEEDNSFSTSVSFGIAELLSEHKDTKDLLKAAHQALDKAKKMGRSSLVIDNSDKKI